MNDWEFSDYKYNLLFLLGKKRGCLFNYHFVREKANQKDSGKNKVNMFSPLLHLLWFWICLRSNKQLIMTHICIISEAAQKASGDAMSLLFQKLSMNLHN